MNSTSFCEAGGSLARVEDGRIRDASPGAPGWTMTGPCADNGSEKKNVKAIEAATLINENGLMLKFDDTILVSGDPVLSNLTISKRLPQDSRVPKISSFPVLQYLHKRT